MRLVSSRKLLQGRVFAVFREKAVGPGGFTIEREIVRHTGSAVMLPRDARGRVLLVRQYRLPARRYLWELPAGRLDPGERPLAAARRELQEETGYRARRWTRLASYYPSPGYTSEYMTIYLAQDLLPGPARPEEDESIERRWFTRREIGRMLRSGRIRDGKTLAGLLLSPRARARPRRPFDSPAKRLLT